jgi:hypothetical protein
MNTSIVFRHALPSPSTQTPTPYNPFCFSPGTSSLPTFYGSSFAPHSLDSNYIPFQPLALQVEYAFLAGLAVVLLLIPINRALATRIQRASTTMMAAKDARIKVSLPLSYSTDVYVRRAFWRGASSSKICGRCSCFQDAHSHALQQQVEPRLSNLFF